MTKNNINNLRSWAQFSLFTSSYLPLFILIIAKQLSTNSDYYSWGGISYESVYLFITKFGLSLVLIIISIIGFGGLYLTLKNLNKNAKNGFPVIVKDIKNKSSESISYIATYIIPFVFQGFTTLFEFLAILFLILIIYRIYINSSLLLINPILNLKYTLYEIEYEEAGKSRNGLLISKDKYLQEEEKIKLYEIGHKLYYANKN